MTDIEKATKQHQQIADMLREEKLLAAIGQMKLLAENAMDWNLKSEVENMETTYRSMLQYLSQGMSDPERGRMYGELRTKGLVLNDRLLRSVQQQTSSVLYHQTLRQLMKHPKLTTIYNAIEWIKLELEGMPKEEVISRKKHQEELEISFFNLLWTSDVWSVSEREAVYDFIVSSVMPDRMAALAISAVTLGFFEMYDPQKYLFLFDAYRHPSELIRQRAVCGIALGCLMHDNRMKSNAEIRFRVEELAEDANFVRDLRRTQMQILQSCETERISKFMNEEFIPEMMKNPLLKKKDKTGLDELTMDENFNPEWEKWIDSKKVKNKLNIMNELHSMGADIHMASFAHMKNFPFFRTLSNWFIPFDSNHSVVSDVVSKVGGSNKVILNMMTNGSEFCDSDSYSFYLFLSSMPDSTLKMVGGNLPTLDSAMEEELKELAAKGVESENINRKYIQNIYRFFKLFPRRHEFDDIFEDETLLQYQETLLPLVDSPEHIHDLSLFLFNNKHYVEAEMMFQNLESIATPTVEILQKHGFCFQQQKLYSEAIVQYEQAELMKPDNLWNLVHLAQCYSNVGLIEKATECYQKAETISPDDLNLLLQLGNCFAKQEEYDEAFKRFFKVHYLDEESVTVWRAIAWYSLMAGKIEQAERFYQKIEEGNTEMSVVDRLNIGHMHWVAHRYQKALDYYRKCSKLCSAEEFREMMMNDSDSLMCMGVPLQDLPMIIDLVREND